MKMTEISETLRSVIRRLFECNALKFGQFKLKSGVLSPIYIDLRTIISQPDLLSDLCKEIYRLVSESEFELICGVPYTALTLATCISAQYNCPMVMRRKEAKNYGTKQMLEGIYHPGQRTLIIEDLISSGASILETALLLQSCELAVSDAIVFLDREQSGVSNLEEFGIRVRSVIKISDLIQFLHLEGHLSAQQMDTTLSWVRANSCPLSETLRNEVKLFAARSALTISDGGWKNLDYATRAELSSHPLTKKLFTLMAQKKSNLCVAADLTRCADILRLAQLIGPYIVMFKTHVDIIEDFSQEFIDQLRQIADQNRFVLFEDRKFADIGNTVSLQYAKGIYRIVDWAHLVNAHISPGPGLIKGLESEAANVSSTEPRGCLLIAQMSSAGNLLPAEYGREAYRLAHQNRNFVIGFISQTKLTTDPSLIHITPGIRICDNQDQSQSGDKLGQQYSSPEEAINQHGADLIVVGRGILSKFTPLPSSSNQLEADEANYPELIETVQLYRRRAFDAYLNSI